MSYCATCCLLIGISHFGMQVPVDYLYQGYTLTLYAASTRVWYLVVVQVAYRVATRAGDYIYRVVVCAYTVLGVWHTVLVVVHIHEVENKEKKIRTDVRICTRSWQIRWYHTSTICSLASTRSASWKLISGICVYGVGYIVAQVRTVDYRTSLAGVHHRSLYIMWYLYDRVS